MATIQRDFLKRKLNQGQNIYGTCITSFTPQWPKIVADSNLDFVFLDTEHIPLNRAELSIMCRNYQALGVTPIVRIPGPDPYRASQAIDDGAVGVVVPYIEHSNQIKDLVGAVKYRPLKGEKLEEFLEEKTTPSAELESYLNKYNFGNLCFANIESVPAVERLDELLSIKGLDGVFIGPHDLSINMGIPEQYDHPEFIQAVKKIVQKARSNSLGVGIHFSQEPLRQIEWMKEGVNIIIHSSDMALFSKQLRHDMDKIRSSASDIHKSGFFDDTIVV